MYDDYGTYKPGLAELSALRNVLITTEKITAKIIFDRWRRPRNRAIEKLRRVRHTPSRKAEIEYFRSDTGKSVDLN